MAGYLQVQTFVTINTNNDFKVALEAIEHLFVDIGLNQLSIQEWISDLTWEGLLDFGFASTSDWSVIVLEGEQIQVAPNINGFSQTTDTSVGSNWIEVNLLLKTEEMCISFNDWRYRPNVGKPLWSLINKFAFAVGHYGAFLTDEVGNAKPWYALMGANEGIWDFDLAFIPRKMADKFSDVPRSHVTYNFEQGVGLARREAWLVLPWN